MQPLSEDNICHDEYILILNKIIIDNEKKLLCEDVQISNSKLINTDILDIDQICDNNFRYNKIDFSSIKNLRLKLELKYYLSSKLIKWERKTSGVNTMIFNFINIIKCLSSYNIDSITYLSDDELINYIQDYYEIPKESRANCHLSKVTMIKGIKNIILNGLDIRSAYDRDIWNVKELPGVEYVRGGGHYKADFSVIKNSYFREILKRYCKLRLNAGNGFVFGTCQQYVTRLTIFLNFLNERHSTWKNFRDLSRNDIDEYIIYLNVLSRKNESKNVKKYVSEKLKLLKVFLGDIFIYEWKEAPQKYVESLIPADLVPKVKKANKDSIDYIPDFVGTQLLNVIENLPIEYYLIVYIMLNTGLRISDTINLDLDCLVLKENDYYIETDVIKTKDQDHKIPLVDKTFINILNKYIINRKLLLKESGHKPNYFLFPGKTTSNSHDPMSLRSVSNKLNKLATTYNIKDEQGNIFHFNNHAFRHTFGVKMINNGMSLITLMKVLAHASPEMTLIYAEILDQTQKNEFIKVYDSGAFIFDEDKLVEVSLDEVERRAQWDWKWVHYQMKSVNTPYGTCLQRKGYNCDYAFNPPCLTCNNGNPCKNLLITADDVPKYENYKKCAEDIIRQSVLYNRTDWIEDNEKLIQIYQNILDKIKDKKILFGNIKHLNTN